MKKLIERRAAAVRVRRPMTFARGAAQGAVAVMLLVAAFALASQRPVPAMMPGDRLEALRPAANPAAHLTYLTQAVGVEEAVRLQPVTEQVAAVLGRYARDGRVADRAAQAVVVEGRKHNIEPSLLVGLMIIENAQIDPAARSNVGATGLMQVMPFHSGKWGCDSPNLANIEANICHGVNILADYVKRSPNLDRALLRYNGCVRGTNTPNCHTYPNKVRTYANHASRMMNAVANGEDVRSIGLYPATTRTASARKAPAASKRRS